MKISLRRAGRAIYRRSACPTATLALIGALSAGWALPLQAQMQNASYGNRAEILVTSDAGGSVYHYAWKVAQASANGTMVRIRGKCQSACTLYLSMPPEQVCIYPGTSFTFHRAHSASVSANQMGTDYMLRKYPRWVRDWIQAKGGLSNKLKKMNYAYASRFIRSCTVGS